MTGTTSFELEFKFKECDSGDLVTFKMDGERFKTSTRTIKFCSNVKYKVFLTVRPPVEFYHLKIAGSDLALHTLNPTSGEYTAEWNTTGINPTKHGAREDIAVALQGPCGTLRKVLQSKFYDKENSHAEWGHKLEALIFKCATDGMGTITAADEEFK